MLYFYDLSADTGKDDHLSFVCILLLQENSSPGTSMHDELENISSPSWPGTPVSNVGNLLVLVSVNVVRIFLD